MNSRTSLAQAAVFGLICLLPAGLRAAVPAGALADPRYGLGYLVVTHYPSVTTNDSGDCTAGIQAAINDAFAANQAFEKTKRNRALAVFFPPGIYRVSNVLECYKWMRRHDASTSRGFHILVGSTAGAARPKIKLAAGAPQYRSGAAPRPMISYRNLAGANDTPVPVPDPMTSPAGKMDNSGMLFFSELRNLDFDCNGNPGAVGVVFTGTQWCSLENVKVTATGAFAGFYMLPGAGSCAANLEVIGGQYGIIHGRYPPLGLNVSGSSSGPTIAGLKLQDQTVQSLMLADGVSPITVVGFQITNSQGIVSAGGRNALAGSLTLLDGQIGIIGSSNPPAIINNSGKNLYLRNVYVTGTTNLVKSDSTTTTGAGAWKQIVEYAYNNTTDVANVPPNTSYTDNASILESYSIINGTIQDRTVAFPVSPRVVSSSSAPPSDLVRRHLWASFPSYNGAASDPATVVVSTNAGWNNPDDDTATLQAAIDAAHRAGHGRVFVPGGHYYISNTLTLHANTVLMGAGRCISTIEAIPSWQPVSGEVAMVRTVDDAYATTTLAWLSLATRRIANQAETNYSRFNALHWRAGRNSLVAGVEMREPYAPHNNTQARAQVKYTGNGGGRWYGFSEHGKSGEVNPGYRKLKVSGTTQPLWFYGFNIEKGKGDMDVEITGASNVRMLGMKREGDSPMLVISNSTNIAAYGLGSAMLHPRLGGSGYLQVLGASTNVLMGNMNIQATANPPDLLGNTFYEALTGQPPKAVLWPNHVSLYKRGEIDDTLMFGGGGGGITSLSP